MSWLVPSAVDSEHPGASTPVGSANLMYDLLDAIASDRETWSKTVLLINFDENDGYFDHVPPPVAPRPASGEGDDWYDGKPIGLGAAGADDDRLAVDGRRPRRTREVSDHTSVIRFLERWTGVEEPNISTWRRTVCGDLTSAFDFDRQGRPPRARRSPGRCPAPIARWHPTRPPTSGCRSRSAAAARPARCRTSRPSRRAARRQGRLELKLRNDGAAAAHFAHLPVRGRAAAARARRRRAQPQRAARGDRRRYELAIQGPNRFWYELAGRAAGAAARVDVRPGSVACRTRARARARERRPTSALDVRLLALGYGTPRGLRTGCARQTRTVNWDTDQGWYDVEVTVAARTRRSGAA